MDKAGESPWIQVLLRCYASTQSTYHPSDFDETISEFTDRPDAEPLTTEQAWDGFEFLIREGLVEQTENDRYTLTSRGFETAREHYLNREQVDRRSERADRQRSLTVASLYASVGILLLGLFSLFASVAGQLGVTPTALIFLALTGLVVVLYLIYSVVSELSIGENPLDTVLENTLDRLHQPPPNLSRTEEEYGDSQQRSTDEEEKSKLEEFN